MNILFHFFLGNDILKLFQKQLVKNDTVIRPKQRNRKFVVVGIKKKSKMNLNETSRNVLNVIKIKKKIIRKSYDKN